MMVGISEGQQQPLVGSRPPQQLQHMRAKKKKKGKKKNPRNATNAGMVQRSASLAQSVQLSRQK
jgi:hypothetical protein